MLQTLVNWLKFDIQNLIVEVWWCVAALWLALVVISLIDLAGSSLKSWEKALWMALVVLLPFVGLAFYCIACMIRADYYMVEFLFKKRSASRPLQPTRPTANPR